MKKKLPAPHIVASVLTAALAAMLSTSQASAKTDDISSMEAIIYYAKSTKYVDLRDYKSQLVYLKKALALAPDSSALHTDLGYAYANIQQYGTARKSLDKALQLQPNNKEALSRRAYVSLLKNELPSAIADLSRNLEIDKIQPGYNDEGPDASNLLKAMSHVNNKAKFDAAQKKWGKLAGLFAAMEMRDHLDLPQAAREASKVVAAYPNRAHPRFFRGVCRINMGNYKEAEEDFDLLLKKEPGNPNLLYFRAEARRLRGNLNGALSDYDKILSSGRNLIARDMTAETGKHRGNQSYFDDWIISPIDIHYLKAAIYNDQKEPKKAEESINKALKLNPRDTDTLLLAAGTAVQLNNLDKARAHLKEARILAASPERLKDIELFIQASSSPEGRQKAMRAYRLWRENEKKSPAVLYIVARRMEKLQEFQEAVICWQALATALPTVPENELHLAYCYEKLGKVAESKKALDRAKILGATEEDFKQLNHSR